MKAISPTRLADSGGCARSLYNSCPEYFEINENYLSSSNDQTEEQRAGKIVHNIIQYVFVGNDSEERRVRYENVLKAIENTKNNNKIDEFLIEINGNNNLEKGLIGHKIRTLLWNETGPLLDSTYNLLNDMEKKIENSKGKWKITAEDATRDVDNVQIKVLQEEMIVRTSIDLVFEFEDKVIIGELKTGSPEPYKIERWILQTQLMMKTWKIKYPKDKILGFIINGELKMKGNPLGTIRVSDFKEVEKLEYLHKDNLKPGKWQCKKCIVKDNCGSRTY